MHIKQRSAHFGRLKTHLNTHSIHQNQSYNFNSTDSILQDPTSCKHFFLPLKMDAYFCLCSHLWWSISDEILYTDSMMASWDSLILTWVTWGSITSEVISAFRLKSMLLIVPSISHDSRFTCSHYNPLSFGSQIIQTISWRISCFINLTTFYPKTMRVLEFTFHVEPFRVGSNPASLHDIHHISNHNNLTGWTFCQNNHRFLDPLAITNQLETNQHWNVLASHIWIILWLTFFFQGTSSLSASSEHQLFQYNHPIQITTVAVITSTAPGVLTGMTLGQIFPASQMVPKFPGLGPPLLQSLSN